MNNSIEMPKYKCHKEVWALKIRSIVPTHQIAVNTVDQEWDGCYQITPEEPGYTPFIVSNEYYNKHKPEVGGYYVVYKGGYLSYSPAAAFEEGYSRITGHMNA